MARVYAPARAESYTSDSTSNPKLTPTSSEDNRIPSTSKIPARSNKQPFASANTQNLHMPVYGAFPQMPAMSSLYGCNANAGFNYGRPQQLSMLPQGQFATPYSMTPFSSYSHVQRPVPSHYGSCEPPLYGNGFGLPPQPPLPSAQLNYEAQTEDDAKRMMAQKIVDELMKLDLDKEQVLVTGAALISGLKSSEASRGGPLTSMQPDNTNSVDEPQKQNFREYDDESGQNDDVRWNNNNQECNAGTRSWSNYNHSWDDAPVSVNGNNNWGNGPAQNVTNNIYNDETTATSHLLDRSQSHAPGHFITEPREFHVAYDSWESAGPTSEEDSGTWDNIGTATLATPKTEHIEEPLSMPADKFTDPCLVSAYVWGQNCSANENPIELFVPKTTLMKLLHHERFQEYRTILNGGTDPMIDLPPEVGSNTKAITETLSLLELDAVKQAVICNSITSHDLRADMYVVAVRFHLDTIVKALLDSMSLVYCLEDVVTCFESIYDRIYPDVRVRDCFKSKLRGCLPGVLQLWDVDTQETARARIDELKSTLSDINDQNMKNDIFEVLLDKLCYDAETKAKEELPSDVSQEVKDVLAPEVGFAQEHGEASYHEDMGDEYDSGNEGPWEGFEDDGGSVPGRPQTPDDWNCAAESPALSHFDDRTPPSRAQTPDNWGCESKGGW